MNSPKPAFLVALPLLLLFLGGCASAPVAKPQSKTAGAKAVTDTAADPAATRDQDTEGIEQPAAAVESSPEPIPEAEQQTRAPEVALAEQESAEQDPSETPDAEQAKTNHPADAEPQQEQPTQATENIQTVTAAADEPSKKTTEKEAADTQAGGEGKASVSVAEDSESDTGTGIKTKTPSKTETPTPSLAEVEPEPASPAPRINSNTPKPKHAPSSFEDLWSRLRVGFALPDKDNRQAQSWARRFAAHHNDIDEILSRAQPYLWHIATAVAARGMPMEIALVPAVESGFDPYALSHGNASGLWQFVPATAKRFGLESNWWYDGRRDLDDSTAAALDYLEYLHGMFGDWLLTLAAYNAGEGRVRAAISRNEKAGLPTDFWQLKLPVETRGYIPKLLGLAALIEKPREYAFALPTSEDAPRTAAVQLPGQINLLLAADLAQMEIEDLQELNPGFQQWATHPDGPHRLYLPVERLVGFHERLTNTAPERLITWRRHKVKAGDTLSRMAKRNGVDIEVLRQANNLRSENLHPGDYLLVPAPVPGLRTEEMLLVARQIGEMRGVGGGFVEHSVRGGDTLWDIARHYDVSVADLARANGISRKAKLKPGQLLDIPPDGDEPATMQKTAAASGAADEPKQTVFYRVRAGDTLGAIALRFGVRLKHLLSWNGLSRRNTIHPGQTLKILVPQGTFTTET